MKKQKSFIQIVRTLKSSLSRRKSRNGSKQHTGSASEKLADTLFNFSKESFLICNSMCLINMVNERCASLLMYSEEDLLGKCATDFFFEQENYTTIDHLKLLTLQEQKLMYIKQKSGSLLPAKVSIRKVSEENFLIAISSETVAHLSYEEISQKLEELQFNKDLLEERSAELNILSVQLAQSEADLKELNASKDKFFSILAHDLKSPFAGLLGYMELLDEDFDTLTLDEIKEFVGRVHTLVVNIYDLTKNLLDWSRLQNGRMECNIEKLNLHEIVLCATNLVTANAHNKEISIINTIEKGIHIFADKIMINSVLQNLLSNAIKFTPRGGTIRISTKAMNVFHEVSIQDTGTGMSEETLQKIFRIESVHTTLGTEKEKGTGLGLILCKEMIERQKGAINVESKLNEGTKFSFILPSTVEEEINNVKARTTEAMTIDE